MPRFVIIKDFTAHNYTGLVKKLANELISSSANQLPLVLEEHILATSSRHVHVIWDRWDDIPDENRSSIILEAYKQADLTNEAGEITIALGVTPDEAVALGLLPWKVVPARKKNERLAEDAYKKAFAAEARNTVLGAKAKDLRYARVEDANQAVDRLLKALPGSSWTVVQEVPLET